MRHTYWLILALSVVSPLNNALAASASAGASFDWSTFSITSMSLGAGTPVLTWIDDDYAQSTSASTAEPFSSQANSESDWLTDSFSAAGNPPTWGWAEINANTLSATADDLNPSTGSNSRASAIRNGGFTVSGDGLILFSVAYSIAVEFHPEGYRPGDFATATVSMGATKLSNSSNSTRFANEFLFPGAPSGSNHSERKTGTLYLPIVVSDGEKYSFYASADVSTAISGSPNVSGVPLPAAIWPFLSGLIGLAGASLGRRRIA